MDSDLLQSEVQFESTEPVLLRDLKTGDHIAVKGELRNLHPLMRYLEFIVGDKYYHHGIYMSPTEGVIDFGGNDKRSAKPRKVDVTEFMAGSCDNKLYRINYREGSCLSVEETIRMGEEVVANPNCWSEFDILLNNCETFATYLKTKAKTSGQALRKLASMYKAGEVVLKVSAIVANVAGSPSLASGLSIGGNACLSCAEVTELEALEQDKKYR